MVKYLKTLTYFNTAYYHPTLAEKYQVRWVNH